MTVHNGFYSATDDDCCCCCDTQSPTIVALFGVADWTTGLGRVGAQALAHTHLTPEKGRNFGV